MKKYISIALFIVLLITGCASSQQKTENEEEIEETTTVNRYTEAEKNYSSAYEYLRQGNYEKAEELLKKAIDDSTTYVDAYIALRKVYLQEDAINEAIEACKEGLETCKLEFKNKELIEGIDNATRKMTLALADLYAKLDMKGEAEELFEEIIEDEPDDANSYDLYASYLESQGRIDEAIEYYRRAYNLEPDNKGIAFRLGDAYFNANRYRDALEFFLEAKDEFPGDIDILKKIAESYLNLEEYRNAINAYREVIEVAPKHVSSRIKIGNAYRELGDYSNAERYYKEALEIEPKNLSVYYQLINMELSRKNLSAVVNYINAGFDINPNDPILLALYGEYYYRLGLAKMKEKEWNPSIERFEQAISIWNKTQRKAYDAEWRTYAQKGIQRANKMIEEVKKVRW